MHSHKKYLQQQFINVIKNFEKDLITTFVKQSMYFRVLETGQHDVFAPKTQPEVECFLLRAVLCDEAENG